MPTITFREPDGSTRTVDAPAGTSVMRAAILNGIRGIIGECGGQAMCATCHVYVESSDGVLPEIGDDEAEMLECTAAERRPDSRLGCQLRGDGFGAVTVQLPDTQV
jgi:2Fe-2S ferredoxin